MDCLVKEPMNLLQSIDPAYVFSGFCVGSLVGLTGVGGGSLMTPVLILVFGVHPVAAVGTDLLYAAATKTIATVVHGLGGTIDWKIVARLASGSLPSTALTVWILSHFDMGGSQARRVISFLLGVALLATAITIVLRPWLIARLSVRPKASRVRRTPTLTMLTGVALGVLVSLTSVGGGRHGAGSALSDSAAGADYRVRYRACGTTHPARRRRPLDRRNGERHNLTLSTDGLTAGGHRGQPRRWLGARARVATDLGDGADDRRGQAGVLKDPTPANWSCAVLWNAFKRLGAGYSVLQRGVVEHRVGQQPLQLGVLHFQSPPPLRLTRT